MQTSNSFGVIFFPRYNKAPKDGKYPVYAKITVNGDESEMSIKMRVRREDWHDGKGMTKGKTPDQKANNTYMELVRSKCTSIFRQMELDDEHLTAERIKLRYLNLDEPAKKLTVKWLFEEHNTKMVGTLAPGTLKNYRTTYDYLIKFLPEVYKGDVLLRHLEYNFIEDFKTYILENPLKVHDPCENNGVMKHLERLKKVANWACVNHWLKTSPFQYFSLKFNPTDIEFLSLEQVQDLMTTRFLVKRLDLVRDLFLFSCFTGLAYSDLMDFGPEKIRIDKDGNKWIYGRRTKSKIKSDVPLLPIALQIMEKYSDDPRALERGKCFPLITNQEMNRDLKLIAEKMEYLFELTHHIARHTFATLLITFDVPVTSVQKIMGHTKIATTMRYVHLLAKKVQEDMQGFWQRVNKPKNHRKKSEIPVLSLRFKQTQEEQKEQSIAF